MTGRYCSGVRLTLSDRAFFVLLLITLNVCGCAHQAPPTLSGPSAILEIKPCAISGDAGSAIVTRHYVIFTTIDNPVRFEPIARVMEGANAEYRSVVGRAPPDQRSLVCYLFATREQWADFTRSQTGDDASIYLHITRGGYTVGDRYVAYDIGLIQTLSVAAHEGFHQFCARHCKTRLPPTLEEGLACTFETVEWRNGFPMWDTESNPNRAAALRRGTAAGRLLPLEKLITMHAGQVVAGGAGRISAYYGQSWALAMFLLAGENGLYRPRLQKLFADSIAGLIPAPTTRSSDPAYWDPASAKPLLERYFKTDLATLDQQFRAYVQTLNAASADEY
jgi:hypothetical protein